jgi:subtilisin-like proprotein convertase family protein
MSQFRLWLLTALLLGASAFGLRAQLSETNRFLAVNKPIPDGTLAGVHDVRTIASDIVFISSIRVRLNISGNFNGDLYGYIRHSSGLAILLNRPGRSSTNAYGYSDAGLDITLADDASNDIHPSRSLVVPAVGSPLTGTWQPDARYVSPRLVTEASARSAFLSAFNGLSASGDWTLFLADLDLGGTNFLNSWSLEIAGAGKLMPVITWANPAPITYPAALTTTQLNATADVAGTFSYSPTTGTVLNAGSQLLSVTFTPADTNHYRVATTNAVLSVLPKTLTITAEDKSTVYGAALPQFTASYSGFANGESAAHLDTPVVFATPATAASGMGTYPVIPSGASDGNYTIIFINGTLTITPAALHVTISNATRIYGQTNPEFTGTLEGVLNGDNLGLTYFTSTTTNSPVGNYAILPAFSDSEGKLANYTVTTNSGTLSINPAALTVTADDLAKVYGAPLPELTASYDGFVNGESTNQLSVLAALTTIATASSNVGNYPITASGGVASNYLFSYFAGTLTITQSFTTGAITSSTNPALAGSNLTFTLTVSAVAPGVGMPGGSVNFRINDNVAGSATLVDGSAAYVINTLETGSYTVAAEYAGDLNFHGVTNALAPDQIIDTPPELGGDILERYPSQGIKVRASTLVANDLHAGPNVWALRSVSGTSDAGGTVQLLEDWVFYEAPTGFTNADRFTYVATNHAGATATFSVRVNVRVDVAPGQNVRAAEEIIDGVWRIEFQGIAGRSYLIQSTENLNSPVWQNLGTSQADATGWFEFIDTRTPGSPARFYRSVIP